MKRGIGTLGALGAAAVLLVAVNLLASAGLRNVQWDWTEESLYTLSDGSRKLLEGLDDAVKLRLFYSRTAAANVPVVRQYADRVLALLRQYEAAAGGRIALEQLEPRPDTEVEEWAVKYGLQGAGLAGGEDIYLGLVAVSEVGAEAALPFLSPQREAFLEYDITRLIAGVGNPERKRIGVLSTLDLLGNMDDPMVRFGQRPPQEAWVFAGELRKQFEVVAVEPGAKQIDPSLDLLLLVHPKNLADATLYAVDQYLLRGGRLAVLVDPHSAADEASFAVPDPNARMQASFASDLPQLFAAWGIELIPGKVVADPALGTQVRFGSQVAKHPAFLSLGPEQANQEEIISADMENLLFVYPGALRIREAEGTESGLVRTPLLRTSDAAGLIDAMMLKLGMDPQRLEREVKPEGEALTLALKLTGRFPSAFTAGPPADAEEPAGGPLTEATAESAVVVFADTDFVSDDFSARKQNLFGQTLVMLLNDNLALVSNAAEVLMGAQELATLRTRGKSDRPFTLVDRLEREAQEKWQGVEEDLLRKQEDTNRRLNDLERGKSENERAVLSASQLDEIQKFRDELAANKKRLREVRRNLRQEIEDLGTWVKVVNIALMPGLVLLVGFVPVLWRARRRSA